MWQIAFGRRLAAGWMWCITHFLSSPKVHCQFVTAVRTQWQLLKL